MSDIETILESFGSKHVFASASVGAISASGKKISGNWGEANKKSLFDCASLTKVWPTGELIALAISEHKIWQQERVEKYLPETRGSSVGARTIWELQTYAVEWKITMSEQKELSAEELLQKLWQTQTVSSPVPVRSNATSIVLGLILEQVYGQKLHHLAKEQLFAPLKLQRTSFSPRQIDASNLIPSEIDPWRERELRGEVHDESAWILQQGGYIPGSAGLFSCLDDLLQLAQWQLQTGWSRGLGWETRNEANWIGKIASASAYGKTGFTGCSVVIDPQSGGAAVLLSNATYPQRPTNREPLDRFRREMNDALLSAIV